ncbi:hypothetical protein KUTeg_019046 [Tegillarca granosa]|uniref:Uncharacterized protein n=1 Tax=Tegillarca granosa TaxID=220873 RepID=A0ABQ9EGK4_TEGGR|nr:hypothetical protein KUTeg_019046 [Tegillarca granosa]
MANDKIFTRWSMVDFNSMSLFAALLFLVNVSIVNSQCACATTDVHVRSGPGVHSHVYTTLFKNHCLTEKRNGATTHADGYDWVNVDYNGKVGLANQTDNCDVGSHYYNSVGTAYYPSNDPIEGGFVDMRGAPLKTLQDFLEGKASYVSVAMDNHAGIAYGTHICIPQLNKKYQKVIDFRVVDTGSAFMGKYFSRIDICVRTRHDSFDDTINNQLTLVFP